MIDENISNEDLAPDCEDPGDPAPQDLLDKVAAPDEVLPDCVDEPDDSNDQSVPTDGESS